MANPRTRKSAPTPRTAVKADDPIEPAEATKSAPSARATKANATRPAKANTTTKTSPAAKTTRTAKPNATTKTSSAAKTSGTAKATKSPSAAGASSRRFGDGGSTGGARKKSPPTKSSGRGGRGGRGGRPAPAVRVGAPKPWGTIAATVAVLLFAAGAIGYAVYEANSNAVPDSPSDIEGITIAEYGAGQEHVTTDVTYEESPPIGGPHDGYWADCDGAVYDQQIRSENAMHSLEHGGVWLTYNPDISADDLSILTQYVENQPYIMMSPYEGLTSLISLQSWNHQLFVDSVDDERISDFIQVLRQNPEVYPEVGASCSQPTFLTDPVLEGEQSRIPTGGGAVTDEPTTP